MRFAWPTPPRLRQRRFAVDLGCPHHGNGLVGRGIGVVAAREDAVGFVRVVAVRTHRTRAFGIGEDGGCDGGDGIGARADDGIAGGGLVPGDQVASG